MDCLELFNSQVYVWVFESVPLYWLFPFFLFRLLASLPLFQCLYRHFPLFSFSPPFLPPFFLFSFPFTSYSRRWKKSIKNVLCRRILFIFCGGFISINDTLVSGRGPSTTENLGDSMLSLCKVYIVQTKWTENGTRWILPKVRVHYSL